MTTITEEKFWEDYWSSIKLPVTVNYDFNNDNLIANTIKKYVPKENTLKVAAEIGCAPGKWLVFLNKELGYQVEGYEYVKSAAEKTIENLKINNIFDSKIFVEDFTTLKTDSKYDLVISLGFIEHFDNYMEIVKKHVELLNKDSYLVLGVPNFRGISYYIQLLVDFFISDKLIPKHNLKVMDIEVFNKLSQENNLKNIFVGYIGGFEQSLFPVNQIKSKPARVIFKIIRRLINLIFGKINNKYTSGYLIGIFKK